MSKNIKIVITIPILQLEEFLEKNFSGPRSTIAKNDPHD